MIEITNVQAESLLTIIADTRALAEKNKLRAIEAEKALRAIWLSGEHPVTPQELDASQNAIEQLEREITYLTGLHAELSVKLENASFGVAPRKSALDLLNEYENS